jgi:CheY-like chemotaxis protein
LQDSILVVDNERTIADTLAQILRRAGHSAVASYGGEDALALVVAHGQPAALLTDVIMPGVNGIELAIRVRSLYPNCPILLISGNASTDNMLEGAQRQGHDFEILAKPIPPPEILSRVKLLLATAKCETMTSSVS